MRKKVLYFSLQIMDVSIGDSHFQFLMFFAYLRRQWQNKF